MSRAPKQATQSIYRCAVYTRKSTDHNLDLEFNSLDSQREACEAYIKSQAGIGWRLIPERFDDGAFSGASLIRPSLQNLLELIRLKKVDIIVVYKVDRLTRSLADFARLVELFDKNNVSFVAVTQSFNTTSSMGRLTLNILLSFAQFEREVIGERVRDKIAASKKKGIWVGGPISLGYASRAKRLVIVPSEAETVRLIFSLYLELGSVRLLAEELRRRKINTKRRSLTSGRVCGGGPFTIGPLHHLLRNRFYVGDVLYRGDLYPGEHEPILDRVLFDAVQEKLGQQAIVRKMKRSTSPAILTGLIFDANGVRMTPTHANKRGVRYRYYVSQTVLQGRSKRARVVTRVPAPNIEDLVVSRLQCHLAELVGSQDKTQPREEHHDDLDFSIEASPHPSGATEDERAAQRSLLEAHIDRIVVKGKLIEVSLRATDGDTQQIEAGSIPAVISGTPHGQESRASAGIQATTLIIPWPKSQRGTAVLISAGSHPSSNNGGITTASAPRDALLSAIAKARRWVDDLANERVQSFVEIAQRENKVERHIRFLTSLAFISPRIVSAIAADESPANLTISGLAKLTRLSWKEQETMLSQVSKSQVSIKIGPRVGQDSNRLL